MADSALGSIELELKEIRLSIERLNQRMRLRAVEPQAYSIPDAARVLGVGLTKMRELVKSGRVLTVSLGSAKMVPASEIERLTTPEPRQRQAAGARPARQEHEVSTLAESRAWRRAELKKRKRS